MIVSEWGARFDEVEIPGHVSRLKLPQAFVFAPRTEIQVVWHKWLEIRKIDGSDGIGLVLIVFFIPFFHNFFFHIYIHAYRRMVLILCWFFWVRRPRPKGMEIV
jgi:hypothetical protein